LHAIPTSCEWRVRTHDICAVIYCTFTINAYIVRRTTYPPITNIVQHRNKISTLCYLLVHNIHRRRSRSPPVTQLANFATVYIPLFASRVSRLHSRTVVAAAAAENRLFSSTEQSIGAVPTLRLVYFYAHEQYYLRRWPYDIYYYYLLHTPLEISSKTIRVTCMHTMHIYRHAINTGPCLHCTEVIVRKRPARLKIHCSITRFFHFIFTSPRYYYILFLYILNVIYLIQTYSIAL